ncbi:hypothetical protein HanRHA438_Chr12g0559221 [Helianthus annuus]|nr:hypothetical protein HanRHA438_Chr12g0559221 [Helianthus annuus]
MYKWNDTIDVEVCLGNVYGCLILFNDYHMDEVGFVIRSYIPHGVLGYNWILG